MNILAFDTCFDACSVAAGRGLGTFSPDIVTLFEPMSSGQAERLVPMIDEALTSLNMGVSELDRIVVTCGPGTFTGTRIAVSAARALALIGNTSIVPVSTLHLMAMSAKANASGADELAIATDARRGEVYVECFEPHTLRSLSPAAVLPVSDAVNRLKGRRVVVAGSGAEAMSYTAQALGRDVRAIEPHLLPDSVDVLLPAMRMVHFNSVRPVYLRPPDAKPQIAPAIA